MDVRLALMARWSVKEAELQVLRGYCGKWLRVEANGRSGKISVRIMM